MAISESPSETIGRSGISVADVTVARLSQAMAAGTLTSAELARFYTERIERHNPALGAVISVSADAAEQARAVDQARAAGAELGPLAGVPVLIKDNISVAGSPATAGSPALAGAPPEDAVPVRKPRAARARILRQGQLFELANLRSNQ